MPDFLPFRPFFLLPLDFFAVVNEVCVDAVEFAAVDAVVVDDELVVDAVCGSISSEVVSVSSVDSSVTSSDSVADTSVVDPSDVTGTLCVELASVLPSSPNASAGSANTVAIPTATMKTTRFNIY